MSNINPEVFRLNFNYLIETNTKKELQCIAKILGEKNVSYINGIKINKTGLCNMILNNKKFIFKDERDLKKTNKDQEYENKIKYYKKLKTRLYKDITYVKNI